MWKKLPLHWKILIGLAIGVGFGFLAVNIHGGREFTVDWIKPLGTIFINALKLLAVPLIVASLINGVAELKDISQLSKLGTRTIIIYIVTTVIAVSLGLVAVNVIKPGKYIAAETQQELLASYEGESALKMEQALSKRIKAHFSPW